MWTAKDNGKDVSWKNAVSYCHDLRLEGYSDWRLATIDELQAIYDDSGYASRSPAKDVEEALAGKPKGGLLLTGKS